jgi:hypothetical protein
LQVQGGSEEGNGEVDEEAVKALPPQDLERPNAGRSFAPLSRRAVVTRSLPGCGVTTSTATLQSLKSERAKAASRDTSS